MNNKTVETWRKNVVTHILLDRLTKIMKETKTVNPVYRPDIEATVS